MATDVERLAVLIEANTKSYENAMKKLQQQTDRTTRSMEKRFADAGKHLESTFSGIGSTLTRTLGTLGLGIGGAQAIRAIANASAEYVKLQNALKVTGLEGEGLQRVMGELFQIAQKQGTEIGSLTTLYSRVSASQKELNASSADLMKFTDGVALALRVAGTDSQAASGALLQLSQAMGGGVIQAQEFNSLVDGARPILQTVAAGLEDAGGSVAKLTRLVKDGEVSSEAFFRAFLAGMPQLESMGSKATDTVSQATTRAANAFTFFIGKLDESVGASKNAAENIGAVGRAIEALPGFIASAEKGLSSLQGWFDKLSNNPFWTKLGQAMGLKFTAEEMEGAGFALPDPSDAGEQPLAGAPTAGPSKVKLGKKGKGGKGNTVGVDSFERAIAQSQKRIELLNAETQTIGLNTAAQERARIVAELETAAKAANAAAGEKNTEVTEAQRQKINEMADAMQNASQRNYELTQAFEAQNSVMQFAGEQTIDLIKSIGGTAEERANALKNVLNQVLDAMLKATLLGEGPLAGMFGTKSASGGVGGIFGILAKTFAGGFATGGTIPSGQWGVVGERGPEIVTSGAKPLHVSPNASMGGKPVTVIVQNTNHFSEGINGTDRAAIQRDIAIASARTEQSVMAKVQTLNQRRAS